MKNLLLASFFLTSLFFQNVFLMNSDHVENNSYVKRNDLSFDSSSGDELCSDSDFGIDKDIVNFLELFEDVVRLRHNLPVGSPPSRKVDSKIKKKRNNKYISLSVRYLLGSQHNKFGKLHEGFTQLIGGLRNFSKIAASSGVELDEGVVFNDSTISMLNNAYDSVSKDLYKDSKEYCWDRGLNSLNELEWMFQNWYSNILFGSEEVRYKIEYILYKIGNLKDLMGDFLQ